ncbi:MAG: RDD family protein [Oscillospiraceae bacterium]|nr:RDD family protein [Oscillospiraceae bacterium]
MVYDLQKAGMWKRLAAWMFDMIFVVVLAVGLGFVLSALLGYNDYNETVQQAYAKYEAEYGISFEISQDEYQAMSEAQRQNFDAALQALTADEEAMNAETMALQLSLAMTTVGIFIAILIWEYLIPLYLKNGQTLGKKAFSLCVMRNDGVRVNNLQLFTRAVLGKFAIETMIPLCIGIMLLLNIVDMTGTIFLIALLVVQLACIAFTRTNSAIHDLLAGTVVVDMSQRIFPTTEALVEFQKQVAAEQAARATY